MNLRRTHSLALFLLYGHMHMQNSFSGEEWCSTSSSLSRLVTTSSSRIEQSPEDKPVLTYNFLIYRVVGLFYVGCTC